tara:strand:+ start:3706 stop:3972 length:267 start_codon:yes stop_codon:yes gene_type:complete
MDVKNTTNDAKNFQEQTIELTFKSQKEIDVFYGLFNHTLIGDFLRGNAHEDIAGDIRNELRYVKSSDARTFYRTFEDALMQFVAKRLN